MKNLKITPPDGYEIDKVNSTFENIVFKPIKKELPKSWGELGRIEGWFTSTVCDIHYAESNIPLSTNLNTFATKEQAEASLALSQLSQLLKVYREGEKAIDWTDRHTKYCIEIRCGKAIINVRKETHHFLSFYSEDTCKLFLTNFRDLIEQAKPLMS